MSQTIPRQIMTRHVGLHVFVHLNEKSQYSSYTLGWSPTKDPPVKRDRQRTKRFSGGFVIDRTRASPYFPSTRAWRKPPAASPKADRRKLDFFLSSLHTYGCFRPDSASRLHNYTPLAQGRDACMCACEHSLVRQQQLAPNTTASETYSAQRFSLGSLAALAGTTNSSMSQLSKRLSSTSSSKLIKQELIKQETPLLIFILQISSSNGAWKSEPVKAEAGHTGGAGGGGPNERFHAGKSSTSHPWLFVQAQQYGKSLPTQRNSRLSFKTFRGRLSQMKQFYRRQRQCSHTHEPQTITGT